MNLYLIYTGETDYDTYDSYVVNEKNEEEAIKWSPDNAKKQSEQYYQSITLIGKSNKDLEKGIVIASFNAG